MAILFAENLAVMFGTLLLASPLLAGVALVVWTHRLAERGRIAYAPTLLAVATVVAGVAVAANAPSGLGGIGHALLGIYLMGAGGLTALVCGLVTYGRAARPRPGPSTTAVRRRRPRRLAAGRPQPASAYCAASSLAKRSSSAIGS
jgi:hypothetical protein